MTAPDATRGTAQQSFARGTCAACGRDCALVPYAFRPKPHGPRNRCPGRWKPVVEVVTADDARKLTTP